MKAKKENLFNEKIAKYIDGNPSVVLPIFDYFVKNKYPQLIQDLDTAITLEKWEQAKHIAHKLKGSVGVFVEQKIWDFAVLIEEELQSPKVEVLKVKNLVEQLRDIRFEVPPPV